MDPLLLFSLENLPHFASQNVIISPRCFSIYKKYLEIPGKPLLINKIKWTIFVM
jgi:hypothetical protein